MLEISCRKTAFYNCVESPRAKAVKNGRGRFAPYIRQEKIPESKNQKAVTILVHAAFANCAIQEKIGSMKGSFLR